MPTYQSVYPPAQNSTYVKATTYYSTSYYPWFATDPTKSLTGAALNNSWLSTYSAAFAPLKFNIDLGSAKTIARIYLENDHNSGAFTDEGIKDFYVYGTDSAAAFANTTYADTTDLTLLGSFTAARHVAADVPDPQYFILPGAAAYRYYVFRLVNSQSNDAYKHIRRLELQEDVAGGAGDLVLGSVTVDGSAPLGNLTFSAIELSGVGAGYGELTAPSVEISGDGGGTAALSLPSIETDGTGGGTAVLTLNNITIAGTGDTSIPANVGGSLSYEATSGITLWSHKYASVGGTLGYSLTSGIVIDVISVGGELPYSVSSGIAAHSQNDTIIAGALGYSITSGIEAHSHIAVSVGGALAYELTSGITADRDLAAAVGGTLPYSLTSGISAWPSAQADVGGDLGYILTSGIIADGGNTCTGALGYSRDSVY